MEETEITITEEPDLRLMETIKLNPDYYRLALKLSLYNFIKVFHYYLYKTQFEFKDFHHKIIDELEDEVFEEQKNLVITMPPRYGKSSLVKYFLAWSVAINPKSNNIYTSYSNELVQKFSGEIRDLVSSPLYRALFGIRVSDSSSSKSLWDIEGGGSFRAASLASPITGFGAGVMTEEYGGAIIIDDVLKSSDARSETEKRNCIDYYVNVLKSRRNNKKTPCIVIMQRLAVGDLISYLEENERADFTFLNFPARIDGKSIWPEKFTDADLAKMEAQDPRFFATQYMQSPTVDGGNVIKVDRIKRYSEPPDEIVYTKIFADTAFKKTSAADNSVLLTAGYTRNKDVYILDVFAGKLEFPELLAKAREIFAKYRGTRIYQPRALVIEDKGSGISLIQSLRREGINVEPVKPTVTAADGKPFSADKYQRLMEVMPRLESQLFVPEKAPWLPGYLKELSEFSADFSHAHDDQVDATIYALKETYRAAVHSKF